jgi:tight adherence protein B
VHVLSAEGRMSAVVLVAIPFLIAGFLSIVRPEYIGILVSDIIGRYLVMMAFILMICGIFVMKRMVSIKV